MESNTIQQKLIENQRKYQSDPLRCLQPSYGSQRSFLDGIDLELDTKPDTPIGSILVKSVRDGVESDLILNDASEGKSELQKAFERRNAQVHANAFKFLQ